MNRKIHISTAFFLTITVAGALLALFYSPKKPVYLTGKPERNYP